MRRLVTYHLLSLDGVATSPERWVFDHFDAEMWDHLRGLVASQDTVLLGRVTYEGWASYWPTSTDEPFASFINGSPKYVASRTLDRLGWANSTLIDGDVAEAVARLKAEPGRDIGVHGSLGLTRSLLRAGCVDELRVAVLPVIVGAGGRLFEDPGELRRLQLVGARQTTTGGMLLAYQPRSA
jgi:dihydrofolate reductase